ncbi:MAG: AAA family ATPase [Paludibacter sp.]
MANDLRLEISDFRAIGHADIILDGITVIAGENGSGKSTISKLLYHTIKVVNEYDNIVDEQLKNKLRRISSNFKDVLRDYSYVFDDREARYEELNKQFTYSIQIISSDFDESKRLFAELTLNLFDWIIEIIDILQSSDWQNKMRTRLRFRNLDIDKQIEKINKNLLSNLPSDDRADIADSALDLTFNRLKEYIETLYTECNDKKYNRRIDELFRKLKRQFETDGGSINYNIYESELAVINREFDKLSTITDVRNIIYIDTPMAIGALDNNNKNEHWNDLNKLLMNDSFQNDDTFSSQIIHGSAKLERNDLFRSKFIFKRDDGQEFNLLDVATGIRSFAILQMLLNNGTLQEGTLLILDEPEAHLHPQWIVEYGRFLVYLNQVIGVKLLVASHSPDMISALKYITEKEGNPENLNFYLAEQRSGEYQYDYKHLGVEIEEIFSSYNKSFDKLNDYTA